jgi:UDP-N-acetylglucosamine diphosphorylase/glucosamine-1-phosphate N-acetyltransferase
VKSLVVFEDERHTAFSILAALRGVFDLRCGGRTLLERLYADSGAQVLHLVARPVLHELLRETHPGATVGDMPQPARIAARSGIEVPPDDVLLVSARLLALGRDLSHLAAGPAGGVAVLAGGSLVAARCPVDAARRLAAHLQARLSEPESHPPIDAWLDRELPAVARLDLRAEPDRVRDGSRLLEHAWDLVLHNGAAIIDDFRKGPGAGVEDGALLYPGVHLVQDGAIHIAAGVRLKPGVVLDAEDGPITLEAGVQVQPGVVVSGPVHVGPGCLLKAGAKIHEGTSLGPGCKVGGEVEESVVQGWSNKQHEGFLGHAWLGEWVNLGADTNNSDLKNNYSNVRVWEDGRSVDTGAMFVGLLAADHVKSAIDTTFNTGTVVGLSSQIFGAGFPPKFVPPFSWGGAAGLEAYDFERALETARAVMQRRKRILSEAYGAAFRAAWLPWRDVARGGA